MENFGNKRIHVSEKLEREMDKLEVLKDSLSRSETMTTNMLGILSSFENRLSKLEETIIPIYKETGNLQRRHENIDKTLEALDHVIGYYHVAEKVEPVIRDGPSNGLENYLACMEKLQKATQYFTSNHPESAEMSQVTTLYEAGKEVLEREFRNLLTRHTKPVPPVVILDVLADDELETAEPQTIEQLSARTYKDLCDIASWLLNSGYHTDYMQVYSKIRSNNMNRTLQGLKEHFKVSSKDSGSSNYASPAPSKVKTPSKDTPMTRKAMKRMEFVRKASNSVRKQMAKLEAAGLVKHGALSNEEETIDTIDIDYYITAVSALLKLIQSESKLMQGIIPDKHQRKVFDILVQGPLDLVMKEGEQISGHIRKAQGKHQYTSVISIFPILKHLRAVKEDFSIALEGCQTSTRTKLMSLISNLDHTGARALDEFIDSIRNVSDKTTHMPPDGTVHELTSNTIIFLEQLLEFQDTAGAMLLTKDPTSLPNLPNVDRPKLKLAEFCTKVLSALGLNLSNKSESYTDVTLRSVFMLNNYNYILKSLTRSGLLDLVNSWNNEVGQFYGGQVLEQKRLYSQRTNLLNIVQEKTPDIEVAYREHVSRFKAQYQDRCWSRVMHFIMEPESTPQFSPEKLRDKDKQAIKDRFTGFNKEIEEVLRIQKSYAIPDDELKSLLKKDNKDFVLPHYRRFLKKYSKINFTKNPDKYIRYSDKHVSGFIDMFFDSSA